MTQLLYPTVDSHANNVQGLGRQFCVFSQILTPKSVRIQSKFVMSFRRMESLHNFGMLVFGFYETQPRGLRYRNLLNMQACDIFSIILNTGSWRHQSSCLPAFEIHWASLRGFPLYSLSGPETIRISAGKFEDAYFVCNSLIRATQYAYHIYIFCFLLSTITHKTEAINHGYAEMKMRALWFYCDVNGLIISFSLFIHLKIVASDTRYLEISSKVELFNVITPRDGIPLIRYAFKILLA